MPFLQAFIKEFLRYHSPLGQMLPRAVLKEGFTVYGQFIPVATIVSYNAWTVHRDKGLYGEDADEFLLARWLDNDPELTQKMENMNFAFGGGPRICIGKNIAILEPTKFIPELFRQFELELVDSSRYTYNPGWLVPQTGLDVKVKLGERASLLLK